MELFFIKNLSKQKNKNLVFKSNKPKLYLRSPTNVFNCLNLIVPLTEV